MKYRRFEELSFWHAAIDLAERIVTLLRGASFRGYGSLCDPLERDALNIE